MTRAAAEDVVEQRVVARVVALAPVRLENFSGKTELVGDLGYNSLQLIELAVALEDDFGLDVELESVDQRVVTIDDVVTLVRSFLTEDSKGEPERG